LSFEKTSWAKAPFSLPELWAQKINKIIDKLPQRKFPFIFAKRRNLALSAYWVQRNRRFEEGSQGTLIAQRASTLAILLSHANDQSMHLVHYLGSGRTILFAHRRREMKRRGRFVAGRRQSRFRGDMYGELLRKRLLEQESDFFIDCGCRQDPMTAQNPSGIGIDYENLMVPSIKQDRVGRFRPDTVQCQQFIS
jgi:hypothetical protein